MRGKRRIADRYQNSNERKNHAHTNETEHRTFKLSIVSQFLLVLLVLVPSSSSLLLLSFSSFDAVLFLLIFSADVDLAFVLTSTGELSSRGVVTTVDGVKNSGGGSFSSTAGDEDDATSIILLLFSVWAVTGAVVLLQVESIGSFPFPFAKLSISNVVNSFNLLSICFIDFC